LREIHKLRLAPASCARFVRFYAPQGQSIMRAAGFGVSQPLGGCRTFRTPPTSHVSLVCSCFMCNSNFLTYLPNLFALAKCIEHMRQAGSGDTPSPYKHYLRPYHRLSHMRHVENSLPIDSGYEPWFSFVLLYSSNLTNLTSSVQALWLRLVRRHFYGIRQR